MNQKIPTHIKLFECDNTSSVRKVIFDNRPPRIINFNYSIFIYLNGRWISSIKIYFLSNAKKVGCQSNLCFLEMIRLFYSLPLFMIDINSCFMSFFSLDEKSLLLTQTQWHLRLQFQPIEIKMMALRIIYITRRIEDSSYKEKAIFTFFLLEKPNRIFWFSFVYLMQWGIKIV